MATHKIVTGYGRLWPRAVFSVFDGPGLAIKPLLPLQQPGVYILYRDDTPYYIGKASTRLYSRLHSHANMATDRYFNFWNYFSFLVVPNPTHVAEVESILIAATPSANIAVPSIPRVRLPSKFAGVLRAGMRRQFVADSSEENGGV